MLPVLFFSAFYSLFSFQDIKDLTGCSWREGLALGSFFMWPRYLGEQIVRPNLYEFLNKISDELFAGRVCKWNSVGGSVAFYRFAFNKVKPQFFTCFPATTWAPTSQKMQTFSVLHQKRSSPWKNPFCLTFSFPLRTIFSPGQLLLLQISIVAIQLLLDYLGKFPNNLTICLIFHLIPLGHLLRSRTL